MSSQNPYPVLSADVVVMALNTCGCTRQRLEEAYSILAGLPSDPYVEKVRAEVGFGLALSLQSEDPKRARDLARQSIEIYESGKLDTSTQESSASILKNLPDYVGSERIATEFGIRLRKKKGK